MLKKLLLSIIAVISATLAILITLYTDEVRQAISSFLRISDSTVAICALLTLLLLLLVVCVLLLAHSLYLWRKFDVKIQQESFRFNKYPFLLSSHGNSQIMTNMSYAEITIHNNCKTKINECSLEIILRRDKKDIYKSKVLSSDSTEKYNPMTVSIDGEGDKGFHPVCLNLASFEAFLPNHSLGKAGVFTGILVTHNEYDILGRILYEGKSGKLIPLGKIKIPDDFVNKAKTPNDIQVIIDQGGFAVYVELFQGKVRAKFFGNFTDGDVKRTLKALNEQKLQVDMTIEENGKLRKIDYRNAWRFG